MSAELPANTVFGTYRGAIQKKLQSIRDIKLVTSEHFSLGPENSPRKDLYIYRLDKDGIRYEVTPK
jgi:hypothetical protein